MRILVTGGAGFIGSHIIELALQAGHTLGVLDNLSTGHRENVPSGVTLYEVDLRDSAATRRAVADFGADVVSHQAAQASVSVSVREPHLDAEINLLGGLHLLEACRACATRRVVFASTGGAIYGEVTEPRLAKEGDVPFPESPYAIDKFAFERMLGVYSKHHGFSATILRYANVYGPRQDPHGEAGVVAIFGANAQSGAPLKIFAKSKRGDSGGVRDYVYVTDVARANLLAAEDKLSADILDRGILNVCSGIGTTTRELAARMLSLTGSKSELLEADVRPGDLERSVLDPSRCRRVLGDPTPLEQGLAATLAAMGASRSIGGGR